MTTLFIFIIVCLLVADIILLVSLNRIMRENEIQKEKYTKKKWKSASPTSFMSLPESSRHCKDTSTE